MQKLQVEFVRRQIWLWAQKYLIDSTENPYSLIIFILVCGANPYSNTIL